MARILCGRVVHAPPQLRLAQLEVDNVDGEVGRKHATLHAKYLDACGDVLTRLLEVEAAVVCTKPTNFACHVGLFGKLGEAGFPRFELATEGEPSVVEHHLQSREPCSKFGGLLELHRAHLQVEYEITRLEQRNPLQEVLVGHVLAVLALTELGACRVPIQHEPNSTKVLEFHVRVEDGPSLVRLVKRCPCNDAIWPACCVS
mmetsp:Transcript_2697/g.7068  ORF Transcript_2697/g.7068 Transcript_2697/m.7068 type:complete len:202 (-) Transcript_2697:167-772(-)